MYPRNDLYLRANMVMVVNAGMVVAAKDTADQHHPLSIVVYTIIVIEMMVYATLNLCKIVFLVVFLFHGQK